MTLQSAIPDAFNCPPFELEMITERLETPVSHSDVIEKAIRDGLPVPDDIIEEWVKEKDFAMIETHFSCIY